MTVEIPQSLSNKLQGLGPHFCLVDGKNPSVGGKDWQLPDRLMKPDNPKLQKHLQAGGNYGVVGGGGLIIVEVDDKRVQETVEMNLPETFTVKSGGKGLPHFYYLCSFQENKPLVDRDNHNENIGHIKAEGGMVVGPNSIHPSGRRYEVMKDVPLAHIRAEDLLRILDYYLIPQEEVKRIEAEAAREKESININILDVIPLSGLRCHGAEYFGPHPIHGSTTGQNFHVNPSKNCWHCFRCASGGGPLLWLAVEKGIIECSEAHAGALREKKYWDTIEYAKELKLISEDSELFRKTEVSHKFFNEEDKFQPVAFAKYLMEQYTFKTMKDNLTIYVYDENLGIYKPEGEQIIRKEMVSVLDTSTHKNYMGDIQFFIEGSTFFERPKEFSMLLATEHGLLNPETGELKDFSPNEFVEIRIPVKYNPEAKCPKILAFIEDIVGKNQLVLAQEMIGYCLYPKYPIHRAFMLVGGGANGKSTLIRLIAKLIGKQNKTDTSLYSLCINRFAPAQLYGKLANLCPDLPDKMVKSTGVFKTLTGEDSIQAEQKFKDPFNYTNFAKLIFSANKVPDAEDDTIAYYRRWIIIPCHNTFSSIGRGGTKLANTKILEEICTPEEMSGLLNWALQGLHRLLKKGEFSNAQTWEQQRLDYIRSSNSAKAYFEAKLEISGTPNDCIPYDTLYSEYCKWCETERLPSMSKADFTKNLNQHLPQVKDGKARIDEKLERVWRYVKFKTGDPPDPSDPPSSLLIENYFKNKTGNNSETPASDASDGSENKGLKKW